MEPKKKPKSRLRTFKRWMRKRWRRHGAISSEDITKYTTIRNRRLPFPIKWDMWKAVYCDTKFGNHKAFKKEYFYLALSMCIAQGSYFELPTLMMNYGGLAFIIVLLISYLAFGYPILLMETMIGQYSGRKPFQLLRFMCPGLSGLGIAWYARTFALAVYAQATFIYAVYFAWDSFFCRPEDSVIINLLLTLENQQPEYHFFGEYYEAALIDDFGWWAASFLISSVFLLTLKLKTVGWVFTKLLNIFYLGLAGYFSVALIRTGVGKYSSSITYLPFHMIFKTDWSYLYSGMAWIRALYYVIRSLALGTLIHPYLGCKSFFHYHSNRDAFWIIVFTIIWNFTMLGGSLLWLGYICVNPTQIRLAMKRLNGIYGMLVVFFLKHFQAEMSNRVEPDILFFNGCFIAINGLLSLASLGVYVFILIDCTYTRNGYLLQKVKIMTVFMLMWCFISPSVILSKNGFRHIIYMDFYINHAFSVFFIITCFLFAMLYGVNISKFLFDIVNMIHYKGLKIYRLNVHFMNIIRAVGILLCLVATIIVIFDRPYPNDGNTIWNSEPSITIVGIIITAFPLMPVILFALYYMLKYKKRGVWKAFRPHRDFFKNKYHLQACYPFQHHNQTQKVDFRAPEINSDEDSYSDDSDNDNL